MYTNIDRRRRAILGLRDRQRIITFTQVLPRRIPTRRVARRIGEDIGITRGADASDDDGQRGVALTHCIHAVVFPIFSVE